MQKIIADIAHKRINGESLQSNMRAKENNNIYQPSDRTKNKDQDYEI